MADCTICERQLECQLAGRQICPIDLLKQKGDDTTTEIKDSGDRTEFSTGAVRDLHEGKGRFDLLPMCVLLRLAKHYEKGAQKYEERNWERGIPAHSFADSAFRHLVKYLDGWNDEDHLIAAIWNLCGLAWTEEKRPSCMDIPSRLVTNVIETGTNNYLFFQAPDGCEKYETQKEGDTNS